MLLLLISAMLSPAISAQVISPLSNQDKNGAGIVYPQPTARDGKGLQLPIPPAEHPRLFLTKKDIPVLKEKMNSPLLKDCWNRIVQSGAFAIDSNIQHPVKNNLIVNIRNAIEAKALLFVLENNETAGKGAVKAIFDFFAALNIDTSKADLTREIGRAVVTGAIVYDWCYALLTAAEKQRLIGAMETLAAQMEIKWPLLVQSSVTGHGAEAQLSRDMLSFGVATYDEKPIIYHLAAGRIIAEFVPARKFFYPAAYHHQGSAYGRYRFSWDMVATFIFDKLGYPNIFGVDQAKAPYYFIYSRRPDGQLFRNGDDFNELFIPFGRYWNFGSTSNTYAGSYFKDPILLHEGIKEGTLGKDADYLFDFLFCDGDFSGTTTKTSLPLTKYFKEPFGAMIARTGWEEGLTSATAVAEMKIGVYNFVNHQHLDAGSFQLYYKGPLTTESGIYQGTTGGYGSEHFVNYSQRSIAHNTLLIYDPNEKFTWQGKPVVNDGGQRFPNNDKESAKLEDILQSGYKTGEVLAHAFGPDSLQPEFSYLKGEMAEAYTGKLKSWQRSFVFLHLNNPLVPAALIVFDNVVTANKDLKKYWLLHSVEEPKIKDNQSTITRTEKGYNGKLINTSLLPEKDNISINKVGGAGSAFSVFGNNFPQSLNNPSGGSYDSATWRLEISPKIPSDSSRFLNVMQVMDYNTNTTTAAPPVKIETDKLTGVMIEDRIVLFSKNGSLLNEDLQLRINGSRSYKVIMADMQPGNWAIKTSKNNTTGIGVRRDNQVIYFTIHPGSYVISKK